MSYSANRDWKIDLIMNGTDYQVRDIPRNYKYMAVINGTVNPIEIYAQATTPALKSSAQLVVVVPINTMITVPIFNDTQYTFIYTDGGGSNPKTAQVIFSDNNLNINGAIGSATFNGVVTIGTDSVGLARQAQLPSALGTGGGVKVERVDEGRQTGKATASGDTTIKASAGKVWGVGGITSGVTVKLKDGATEKWGQQPQSTSAFSVPIACSSSIVLNLSGVGEAYVIYE